MATILRLFVVLIISIQSNAADVDKILDKVMELVEQV